MKNSKSWCRDFTKDIWSQQSFNIAWFKNHQKSIINSTISIPYPPKFEAPNSRPNETLRSAPKRFSNFSLVQSSGSSHCKFLGQLRWECTREMERILRGEPKGCCTLWSYVNSLLLKMDIYSEFSHNTWWFSIVMLNSQRVYIGCGRRKTS